MPRHFLRASCEYQWCMKLLGMSPDHSAKSFKSSFPLKRYPSWQESVHTCMRACVRNGGAGGNCLKRECKGQCKCDLYLLLHNTLWLANQLLIHNIKWSSISISLASVKSVKVWSLVSCAYANIVCILIVVHGILIVMAICDMKMNSWVLQLPSSGTDLGSAPTRLMHAG